MSVYANEFRKDDPNLENTTPLKINLLNIPIGSSKENFSTDIYLLTDSNNPFGCEQVLQNHYYNALEELDVYNNRYLPRGEKRVTSHLCPIYAEISCFDDLAASCMAFKNLDNNMLEDGKFILQISDMNCEQLNKFTMNMFFDYDTKKRRAKFFGINYDGRIKGPIHNIVRMNIEEKLFDISIGSFDKKPFLISNIQELLEEVEIKTPSRGGYIGFLN